MHRIGTLALAFTLGSATLCTAQAPNPSVQRLSNPWFFRVGFSPQRVYTASTLSSGDPTEHAVTVEVGRQADGSRDWHRVYNYPAYGAGLYFGRFDQRELGHPLAAYGFFSWPFPLTPRTQITSDFGLGVSWRWREYDARLNPNNTALGSDMAYHVDAGVYLRYLATPRANIYAGLDISHWSNGGTRQPNLGLAVIGPKVGVRYNLAPQPAFSRARKEDLPPFRPAWELVAGAAAGRKNVEGRDVGVFNTTVGLQRHFYRFGKVAAGADVIYDGAAQNRTALGLYGGYEHVIARFSIVAQLGSMLGRGLNRPGEGNFYQRMGIRLNATDRLWTTFAVRSVEFKSASALEFGFGYRWRR
jgi:hypothetical protein